MAPRDDDGTEGPPGSGADDGPRGVTRWDDFELHERIGFGGMGVVYRAWHESTKRWVAVKMPRSGANATLAERARFEREAPMMSKLKHPNIVEVFDSRHHGDIPYLVMELVEGPPLAEWLAEDNQALQARLGVLLSACEAVAHAHRKEIVHRDLKPSNILVDSEGQAKVLDFGVAKDLAAVGITEHGQVLGTPEWLAPEQVTSPDEVDTTTDIHALGLLLAFVLLGQRPRTGARASRAPLSAASDDLPSPKPANLGSLANDLHAIVAKATENDPDLRYLTVEAFRDDIVASVDGRPVRAREATLRGAALRAYVGWKLARRHPWRVALAATVAVLAGAAVVNGIRASAAKARAVREAKEAADIAEYVVGFFEMASADRDGAPIGDAWTLLDHAYRGMQFRPAARSDMSARLVMTMGRAYLASGLADRASGMFQMAVDTYRADPHLPRARLGEALDFLARSRLQEGSADVARAAQEEALAVRVAVFGGGSAPACESKIQLARIAATQGATDLAAGMLEAVLANLSERLDDSRLVVADALEELALIHLKQENAGLAVEQLRRALAIRDERFDGTDPAQATVRLRLGRALLAAGHADEADSFLRVALGMRRHVLGVHGPASAETMMALAEACVAESRFVEADLHASDALEIRRRIHGEEHPRTAESLELLATIRRAQGHLDAAVALSSEAERARRYLP